VPERTRVSEQAIRVGPCWAAASQIRQTDNTSTMRLPLEIAMEVGSFLDQPSLRVCTTQLCWSGVGFVSRPCTDSAKVTTIRLCELVAQCFTASRTLGAVGAEQTNGLVIEAIKRIDLWLARRINAEKVVFIVKLKVADARENADFYVAFLRHFQVSSNRQFNNRPSLAVEWHARAGSIAEVKSLLGNMNGGHLNDGRPLASCQSLHALDLGYTNVCDISALASCQALHTLDLRNTNVDCLSALSSCQALHTLYLFNTRVSDVSALASCQALHTLHLNNTQVSDVSALASCQSLHTLRLCDSQVSDVRALASCQSLHTLRLSHTPVSDVSALALCQALRTLDLGSTRVIDVSALASCQALHNLNLANTKVNDVSALASGEALHRLSLHGTPVSDVSALASCQTLCALELDNSQVSDVSALVACESLRNVYGCEDMIGYEALVRLFEDRSR
jgi:Leucine-rich repeat (LRR) protein